MSDPGHTRRHDIVFIGTSMISVLEAVYQSACGKSVLMIDQQPEMGGAWCSLEIFGLHNVENAIHYLLPDEHAFEFMSKVLKWDVVPSPRKYRVLPLPAGKLWKTPYDSAVGRFAARITEGILGWGGQSFIPGLWNAFKDAFEYRQPSYYVSGGTPEMLGKVATILRASSVEVAYSTRIEGIHIDCETASVTLETSNGRVDSSSVCFTHGSRIANLVTASGTYPIEEKSHLRPAVHLLVRDDSPSKVYECIFTADPLIKYVHDVTRITREAADLAGRKKLFVLALQHDVPQSDGIYRSILDKLRQVGMVGNAAVLEGQYWQDVYLPRLDDIDLQGLKSTFGAQVETLSTENFSRGVGLRARMWETKIRFPENAKNE